MPARSPTGPSVTPAPMGAVRAAFLNVKGAAEYLGLSPHTLYVWRHRRQGPPSFRMDPRGRVMYRREALDAWIREQEEAEFRRPGTTRSGERAFTSFRTWVKSPSGTSRRRICART
ncbi:helix-turn-helix domain-containing protein [Streptomyces sp. NP-1717]|nr:helix-turn-helix domain-containing protein [Streptomyces sp. NP-1717]